MQDMNESWCLRLSNSKSFILISKTQPAISKKCPILSDTETGTKSHH